MPVELWEHQKKWAADMLSGRITALWAMMRTGKTLATIAGTDDGDRLIVCPNSVKGVWKNDLALYGQESYVWGSKPKPRTRPRNVIVNYESVWRSDLLGWDWDSYIFDESIRLQSMQSKIYMAGLRRHRAALFAAKRRICLSGSPCPEGYHQLIMQSWACTGQYCGVTDPWEARRQFFFYDDDKRKWEPIAGHAAQAKKQMGELGYSMTQAEAGINTKKLYRTIQVDMGDTEKRIWDTVDKSMSPANLAMYAQSAASGRPIKGEIEKSSKLDAIVEYIAELTEQVVILTRFTESLHYLACHLEDSQCMYGDDDGTDYRDQLKERFAQGRFRILIANVKVAKVGINLSTAAVIIFAENDWSGDCRIQAEERATVKGKAAIEIVDFVSVGSGPVGMIDQYILTAVRAKKDFNANLLKYCK